MPYYISRIERKAMEKGRQIGRQIGIQLGRQIGIQLAIQKVMQKGIEETNKNLAIKMHQEGLDPEIIQRITGINIEELAI